MRELISAAIKTGTTSILTLGLSALTIKIIAVVAGLDGVGIFSLLKQTHQTAVVIGSLGGQTALVQGIASLGENEKGKFISWGFVFFIVGAILVCSVFFLFPENLITWIFGKNNNLNQNLIHWLPLSIFLAILLTFLLSLINGFRAIGRLAIVQVVTSLVMAILAYPLSFLFTKNYPNSFIILLSLPSACGAIAATLILKKGGWLNHVLGSLDLSYFRKAFDHFFSLGGITLLTSFLGTGTILLLRIVIVRHLGLKGAGFFDAAWTLSMTYVMLILSSFGTYYLPKLSSISDANERTALIQSLMRLSTLLMVPLVIFVILTKPMLIKILYAPDFYPSLKLIRWMLIGDFLKVSCWVLAMPMLAYTDLKTFLFIELFWNIAFFAISFFGIFHFADIQFIGFSFFLLYLLNYFYSLYYVKKHNYLELSLKTILPTILGLFLIFSASLLTWNKTNIEWLSSILISIFAVLFSWFNLSKSERQKIKFICSHNLLRLFNSQA